MRSFYSHSMCRDDYHFTKSDNITSLDVCFLLWPKGKRDDAKGQLRVSTHWDMIC